MFTLRIHLCGTETPGWVVSPQASLAAALQSALLAHLAASAEHFRGAWILFVASGLHAFNRMGENPN